MIDFQAAKNEVVAGLVPMRLFSVPYWQVVEFGRTMRFSRICADPGRARVRWSTRTRAGAGQGTKTQGSPTELQLPSELSCQPSAHSQPLP